MFLNFLEKSKTTFFQSLRMSVSKLQDVISSSIFELLRLNMPKKKEKKISDILPSCSGTTNSFEFSEDYVRSHRSVYNYLCYNLSFLKLFRHVFDFVGRNDSLGFMEGRSFRKHC